MGQTGLVSLGHAAYFGLAGYMAALLSPQYEPANLWLTLPAAAAISALAALVVGLFVLRTSGVYFIMVTLAFAQMFYFIFHDTPLGGGTDGIYIFAKPDASIGPVALLDLESTAHFYYLALAVMVGTYLLLRMLARSTFGRALAGIRANEHRMRSLGYPTFRYKLASFAVGGGLAGASGYLAAMQFGFVNPEILSWHESGNALIMVILGGMGNTWGAALGAFAFVLLQELFATLTKHWQLLLGVTVVLVVLFLPNGLASLVERALGTGEEGGRAPRESGNGGPDG
jgi:branched-chain amino acid transport system permease protein